MGVCVCVHQQGHVGSKTLQQNPPVLNWRCRLTKVDPCSGRKMVAVFYRFAEQSSRRCSGAEAGPSAETDATSHRRSVDNSARSRERKQSTERETVYHVRKTLVGRIPSDP